MAKPATSRSINCFALSVRSWLSSPPWTIGNKFWLSGFLWAFKQRSNHLVVLRRIIKWMNQINYYDFCNADSVPVHGFFHSCTFDSRTNHIVKLHDYVCSDGVLYFNWSFRGQQALTTYKDIHILWVVLVEHNLIITIIRWFEVDSFLSNFCQLKKGDHLEASRVCQKVPRPPHEIVQTSTFI